MAILWKIRTKRKILIPMHVSISAAPDECGIFVSQQQNKKKIGHVAKKQFISICRDNHIEETCYHSSACQLNNFFL